MTITTDLNSSIGELRLLLGDTEAGDGVKPNGGNFSDAELGYFLEQGGGVNLGAALACETLAWMWNLQPDFDADGLTVKRGEVARGWWRAALRFRANQGAKVVPLIRRDAYSQNIPAGESAQALDGDGLE